MARKLVSENVEPQANEDEHETLAKMQEEQAAAPRPAMRVEIPPSEDTGDEVTIIVGAEKYAPVQYHSFDVGPFIVKTQRKPGETLAQVYNRISPALRDMGQKAFKEALDRFLERVRTAASAARGSR